MLDASRAVGVATALVSESSDASVLVVTWAPSLCRVDAANKGCTSGQALTGGAILNVGSLVFMGAVFAAAYALAYFVRKEWL